MASKRLILLLILAPICTWQEVTAKNSSSVAKSLFSGPVTVIMNLLNSTIPKIIPNTTLPFYSAVIRQLNDSLQWALNTDILLTSSICYDQLGCFNKSLTQYLIYLPLNDTPTTFILTTSSAPDKEEELNCTDKRSVQRSRFDYKCVTIFIIYGYTNTRNSTAWMKPMRKSLLNREKCANIILVDWNEFSDLNYIKVAVNTELVGRRIALLCKHFVELGADSSKFHLIGFSLGAQIAGYAGQYLKDRYGLLLGRISALDPAAPGFCYLQQLAAGYHLNSSHAQRVDVIHTNSGLLLENQLSCMERLGHVDFFPNGGQMQAYCEDKLADDPACNHAASAIYYTFSINSTDNKCSFKSYPADDDASFSDFKEGKIYNCTKNNTNACSSMGYDSINYGAAGKQYLMTLPEPPFIASQYKFDIKTNLKSKQEVTVQLVTGKRAISDMSFFLNPGKNKFVNASICTNGMHAKVLVIQTDPSLDEGIQTVKVTDDLGHSKCYNNNTNVPDIGPNVTVLPLDDECIKKPKQSQNFFSGLFSWFG